MGSNPIGRANLGYSMTRKYLVIKGEHAGQTVYSLKFHDYGLASDDTRYTGIEHTSVTLDETGDYPSFTIPKDFLKEI
ncbi:hypothetical protein bastian_115 [Salmonella phage bastian]|uniref:Uncharacterized protein n=18 Tax=Viruses TaxID=10239 RepID=A0A6G8RF78_9CAUD|nr:hypothetical protein HWD24_gp148 [Salmonella phage rokbiter]YP_009858656.1 hypothetical protein HWD26_gp151 [Salmonella phage bastian]QIN99728.1 hypothetical protein vaffelhjerte_108 [Salmonella phage vaffelhjerte]QIO00052.1 hypothetical protein ende_112 [Salmonella phage ende]QIO00547.1 hypothetical protein rokbiter_115 [Salmonella phage rokbiter]QIO00875.1 hypothetical protein bastian_115 [Salmonella phage bastian]